MTKKEMEEVIAKLTVVVGGMDARIDRLEDGCHCGRNEAYEVAKPVIDLTVALVEGFEEEGFSREEAFEIAKSLLLKGM